jgi:HAD superfamily hydrolase (TIGR01457 family)
LTEEKKIFELRKIKCFLLDMDGTIYLGRKLLPGAKEFLQLLDEREVKFLFLTNNSSKSAGQYVIKLNSFGIETSEDQILTSGEATALHLQALHAGSKLYVVGTPSLEQEFVSYGFCLSDRDPDIVVLGFDTTLTYEKLWKICDFIRAGKPYIATHPDINCPTENGFMPDIGSFISLIHSSTGRLPDEIIGKPHEAMIEAIQQKTGIDRNAIAMVGDRLYTDIAMGNSGICTILVLSGEAKEVDIAAAKIKPNFVMKDLSELVIALQ